MYKKIKKKLFRFAFLILFSLYYSYFIIKPLSYFYYHSLNISYIFNLDSILTILKPIFPFSTFICSSIFSSIFCNKIFYKILDKTSEIEKEINNNNAIQIGAREDNNSAVYLNNIALYQNIIVTGAIGSGKTSGVIYPMIEQFISANYSGLILDVKGNMEESISQLAKKYNREKDLIVIELNGKNMYNPLYKPNMKPYQLAARLIDILQIFSNPNSTDTYWYDKAQNMLMNFIKLIRLYNNNYVTFTEIHNVINDKELLFEKLNILKQTFLNNKMNENEKYDFKQVLSYFNNEYVNLDTKISSIINSEVTRITSVFVSDIEIENTFCPLMQNINFFGFQNIFENNSIVLLNMNIGEYANLSKVIACYLKMDFQTEVLKRNSNDVKPVFFICDEYQEYLTKNDVNFYSLSREFKCINVVSSQSYSSLLNSLGTEYSFNVLIQNFINKIFLRTDDLFTIEQIQKLFGKEDKIKYNNTISENANETNYNYLLNVMKSKKSNISESFSTYTISDNLFDSKDFSLNLKSFEAICYISTGLSMIKPFKIKLKPYFERRDNCD